jgi:hypothetical protein
VKLPEETSLVDEIDAELARLRVEQRDGQHSERHAAGGAASSSDGAEAPPRKAVGGVVYAGLELGPNDAAVQVLLI